MSGSLQKAAIDLQKGCFLHGAGPPTVLCCVTFLHGSMLRPSKRNSNLGLNCGEVYTYQRCWGIKGVCLPNLGHVMGWLYFEEQGMITIIGGDGSNIN